MARMPRGEPRSVPDAAGELYDEKMRLEKLRKAREEAAASQFSSVSADYNSPFNQHHLDFLREPPRPRTVTTAAGQQVDSRCVVRPDKRVASPAELEEQRRHLEQVQYMADHPFAGAAYGLSALFGVPERVSDSALLMGGVADDVVFATAPPVPRVSRRSQAPPAKFGFVNEKQPNRRYRGTNAVGQAYGVNASLVAPDLNTGTKSNRRLQPPGWSGNGRIFNEARAHLLANRLGGTGGELFNIVTMTQNGANSPQMSRFEAEVARRVRGGEVVEYSVTPIYDPGVLPPSAVLMTAYGSRGAPAAKIVQNPAAFR